ncbi:MAG: ATP-binding cassette domain-containing protein, partial [Desulfohalobiaceae bacterium]
MKHALDVHDLSFGYGRQPVLRQVSFQIGPGGFFVIIGPNGSGKTTLLRIMAGLQGGFSGRVRVQGQAVQGIPPRRLARIIGHVPQQRTGPCPFSVR